VETQGTGPGTIWRGVVAIRLSCPTQVMGEGEGRGEAFVFFSFLPRSTPATDSFPMRLGRDSNVIRHQSPGLIGSVC